MAEQAGSGGDDASGAWRDPKGAMAGNYRIVRPIAEGAMGIVYLGEHPRIGAKAAVKVLREELASDPAMAERFVEEAKAAAGVRHPNMVKVYDLVKLPDGRPAMVMELLEGRTLDQELAQGPFDIPDAVHVLLQICAVLSATHARGLVHRDIKAENVFLIDGPSSRPRVKLLDFGIARVAGRAMAPIAGTPQYMAPEQVRGEEIDARSDLYAVGVLAYLMLTGRFPFDGRTPREVVRKHVHEYVEAEALPAAMRPLVLKLLAKRREERYPDAAALSAALTALEGPRAAEAAALQDSSAATVLRQGAAREGHPGAVDDDAPAPTIVLSPRATPSAIVAPPARATPPATTGPPLRPAPPATTGLPPRVTPTAQERPAPTRETPAPLRRTPTPGPDRPAAPPRSAPGEAPELPPDGPATLRDRLPAQVPPPWAAREGPAPMRMTPTSLRVTPVPAVPESARETPVSIRLSGSPPHGEGREPGRETPRSLPQPGAASPHEAPESTRVTPVAIAVPAPPEDVKADALQEAPTVWLQPPDSDAPTLPGLPRIETPAAVPQARQLTPVQPVPAPPTPLPTEVEVSLDGDDEPAAEGGAAEQAAQEAPSGERSEEAGADREVEVDRAAADGLPREAEVASPAAGAEAGPEPGQAEAPISPNAAAGTAAPPETPSRAPEGSFADRAAAPQARLLASYLERSERDHYAFLALAQDADPAAVKAASKRVGRELTALRDQVWPAQRSQVVALLARLDRARQALTDLEARAAYDARLGNFRGVACCMAAGLEPHKVDRLRQAYIRRSPELVDRARTLAREVDELRAEGKSARAREVLAEALALDPLSRELHQWMVALTLTADER